MSSEEMYDDFRKICVSGKCRFKAVEELTKTDKWKHLKRESILMTVVWQSFKHENKKQLEADKE